MYHGVVEHGDKVAVLMDKSDLPLLVFLLGKQQYSVTSKCVLMLNGYKALLELLDEDPRNHYYIKYAPPGGGWKIMSKGDP